MNAVYLDLKICLHKCPYGHETTLKSVLKMNFLVYSNYFILEDMTTLKKA